jgi:hypothetical protein
MLRRWTVTVSGAGRTFGLNNDMALRPLCTRIMLLTGVTLRAVRPDQVGDKALLGKVVATLSEMGYTL